MSDKAVTSDKRNINEQFTGMHMRKNGNHEYLRGNACNKAVIGIQNFPGIAKYVGVDVCVSLWEISTVMVNRLNNKRFKENKVWKNCLDDKKIHTNKDIKKAGAFTNSYLEARSGKSKQVRWLMDQHFVPIGYCKSRNPMARKASINQYTPEGRAEIHKKQDKSLESIMHCIMRNPVLGRSVEYNDNRIT